MIVKLNYISPSLTSQKPLDQVSRDNAVILSLIKSKDERGFNLLYDKFSQALYRTIVKFGIRPATAEDLLQDTFVKIWKNIELFDSSKGTIFTWMLNIARYIAIDYLRSSAHRQEDRFENIKPQYLDSSYYGVLYSNDVEVDAKEFETMTLTHLNKRHAEVIEMIYFHGWTQEQTAKQLNIPLGTVKTRAKKGINELRLHYMH